MESALVRRVQELDDHEAFAQLVMLHQIAIKKFLLRITYANAEIAEDLAQETFIAAYKNIKSYRGQGRFLSWLFGIAHQTFLQHLRKNKLKFESLEDWDTTAQETTTEVENKQFISQMLMTLKPNELVAVTLYYQQQLSFREISDIMTIPLSTAKTIVQRSRVKLQNHAKATL